MGKDGLRAIFHTAAVYFVQQQLYFMREQV